MSKFRVSVKYPEQIWEIEARDAKHAKAIIEDLMDQKRASSEYEEPQPILRAYKS